MRFRIKTGCAFCSHKELRPCQTQYIYRYDSKFLIEDNVSCLQCV
ncbi:YgiT-type zinc finger protein [Candidatus Poribacteria bacterium]|nr:YgiT-type zinc finger protein [Candidatus Poribacteria bacterium]